MTPNRKRVHEGGAQIVNNTIGVHNEQGLVVCSKLTTSIDNEMLNFQTNYKVKHGDFAKIMWWAFAVQYKKQKHSN